MNLNTLLDLLSEDPTSLNLIISDIFKKYKGLIYTIGRELLSVYKDLVDNDEWFEVDSKLYAKKVKSLEDAGFSREEAMAITLFEKNNTFQRSKQNSGVTLKMSSK